MFRRKRPIIAIWLAALFCPPPPAIAEPELTPSRFELSGFGTLGGVRTNSDDVEFTRDQSQHEGAKKSWTAKQDSLLGLQAYFKATESLEFVAQAVSRYGPNANYRPELMAAYARFAATPNLSIRAGRMGVEFYMLSDSRLVGYSYLTVRPPVDFFGTLPFQYVNGADFTVTAPLGDGVLKGKAFFGKSGEKAPIQDEFLNLQGNPMAGGYLDYQSGNWQWRVTAAQTKFKHELPPPVSTLRDSLDQASQLGFPTAAEAANQISLTDTTSRFYSVGGVYDQGPLQIQAMLSETRHESSIYQNSRAGYVIAGYRLGQFTPFVGYSRNRSKAKSVSSGLPDAFPPFAQINAGLAGALARTHIDQNTWSLGARWDFRRDMALKTQIDLIRGEPDSVFLYPLSNLNVFSLALDFVF
ncbi:MAG: hypothetical protein Q8S26_18610 [Azonexus sp.]|nr:hypothetical protein [Azonexus sp.]